MKATAERKRLNKNAVCAIMLVGVLFCLPWFVKSNYYIHLLILTFIWVIMTSGLNIIQGYAGYVSLGQISFYGLGAYATGYITNMTQLPLAFNFIIAIGVGLLTGTIIGWPTLKTRGHYFSVATLAFSMLVYIVMDNWYSVTGGTYGFSLQRRISGNLFGFDIQTSHGRGYYFIALLVAVLAVLFVARLVKSRTGHAIISLRENESLAEAIGIDTVQMKRLVFNLSSILGCMSGVVYAHYMNQVNPTTLMTGQSMNAILAVMIGGSGTIMGPVIGSAIVVFLPEVLRVAESYRQLSFGVLLLVIVFLLPNGVTPLITGTLGKLLRERVRKHNKKEEFV